MLTLNIHRLCILCKHIESTQTISYIAIQTCIPTLNRTVCFKTNIHAVSIKRNWNAISHICSNFENFEIILLTMFVGPKLSSVDGQRKMHKNSLSIHIYREWTCTVHTVCVLLLQQRNQTEYFFIRFSFMTRNSSSTRWVFSDGGGDGELTLKRVGRRERRVCLCQSRMGGNRLLYYRYV